MNKEPRINFDTLNAALVLLTEKANNNGNGASFEAGEIKQAVRNIAALERIERGLRRIAEYECNVEGLALDDDETPTPTQAAMIKRRDRLQAKAVKIAQPYGVALILGGDVRGSQVRLACPKSDRHNTMGGRSSGWAL